MSTEAPIVELSWWRLQTDVAWGRALLAAVTMRESSVVRPEIFLFLGDRYWRLARRHFLEGRQKNAERLVRKARMYFRSGGGPNPPPLGVASMPIPERPSFALAVGARSGAGGSNDAA
jgi:hypothetical protein